MEQLLHLVFVFTAAANLVMDKFLCKRESSNTKATKSVAKPTNSFANGMKLIAKVLNSIAKTCIGGGGVGQRVRGPTFDSEMYTMEYEAYNRYKCYPYGSGGLLPGKCLKALRE